MKERTILINGFSKVYAMTGWGLGYICSSFRLIQLMRNIHSYTVVCCSSVSQHFAIESIKNVDADISYMRNGNIFMDWNIGFLKMSFFHSSIQSLLVESTVVLIHFKPY